MKLYFFKSFFTSINYTVLEFSFQIIHFFILFYCNILQFSTFNSHKILIIFNNQNILNTQKLIHFRRNNAILSFSLILFTYSFTINFIYSHNRTSEKTFHLFFCFKQITSWLDFLLGIIKKIIK